VPTLKNAETPEGNLQTASSQLRRHLAFNVTRRQVGLVLVGLALVYAFLSGFHTVFDLDMGWHLATGRYVVQHHAIPRTDVLSYTSPGAEWIYPPFAGVLFYGIYNALGYAGLTWFCALALTVLVACLLEGSFRRREYIAVAVLAIFAMPTLAVRMVPRPDLFTQLFFAIFLTQLWRFHRSGASVADGDPEHDGRAAVLRRARQRLWILPLVMLLWVNLHPGFLAGLGVLIAYLLVEGLELVFPLRRKTALLRLRQAWPALASTVAVTLLNPFGYKIFKSSLALAGIQPSSQAGKGPGIWELQAMPISLPSLTQALDWRSLGSSYWWLAVIAAVVVALALYRRQLGAALVMAVALFGSIQHLRYQGMFAITAVVVGGTILPEAFQKNRQAGAKSSVERASPLRWLAAIVACALCLLVCVRIADLISSRAYIVADSGMLFGPGESWWFPERAAAFIQREHLPGNIFQDYNLGGFTAWRLGPAYGDFIDGRNVDPAVWTEKQEFISSPPDSPLWEKESDRRGINLLFFSLGRFSGGGTPDLMSLCQSHLWRPVYLDEVSIVMLRNRPENRPWIDRFEVNCSSHQFLPSTQLSSRELSNFYANSGSALLSLNRSDEALDSLVRGEGISPDDPVIHRTLALLYQARQQNGDAEREYETALSLRKDLAVSWFDLGEFYFFQRRFADARPLVLTAAQLTLSPVREYLLLGYIDLALHQSEPALLDFSKAEKAIFVQWQGRQIVDPDFYAEIAEGRAQAYLASGEQQRAIESQLEAIRRTPEVVSRWQALASIYDATGQQYLAEQARQKARALSSKN
jgi:Tfp pilus assembly protein PilF